MRLGGDVGASVLGRAGVRQASRLILIPSSGSFILVRSFRRECRFVRGTSEDARAYIYFMSFIASIDP